MRTTLNLLYILATDVECIKNELTLTQLSELLSSFTATPQAYIIVEPHSYSIPIPKVYRQKETETEHTLYDRVRSIIKNTFISHPSMWLSKAPCKDCVTELNNAFKFTFGEKPTLYIETLSFNETDISNIVEDLGCLAHLRGQGFEVKPWDWDTFSDTFFPNADPACTEEIKETTSDSEYIDKKTNVARLLSVVQQLRKKNDIKSWCT